MENYFLLFTDNLVASLILPIYQGFVFKVMLYFKQHHNVSLMLLYGVLGSCLGGIINWYLGRIIISMRMSYHKLQNEYMIPKILLICVVILFSWVPALGSIVEVLSGCFKLKLYIFVASTILSNFFYLLYLVITI